MQNEHHHEHTGAEVDHRGRPYWRRAHRDWKIWVAVLVMLAAMWVYLRTEDLSLRPGRPVQQQVP